METKRFFNMFTAEKFPLDKLFLYLTVLLGSVLIHSLNLAPKTLKKNSKQSRPKQQISPSYMILDSEPIFRALRFFPSELCRQEPMGTQMIHLVICLINFLVPICYYYCRIILTGRAELLIHMHYIAQSIGTHPPKNERIRVPLTGMASGV